MTPHKGSPRPLDVSIVGAGVGGLTAALALRRSGHNVRIFEASQIKTEVGTGIGVQSNPLRVLRTLGFSKENLKYVDNDGVVVFDAQIGIGTPHPWINLKDVQESELRSALCHRSDLHDELKRLALGEGQGPPAQLHLDSKIVACDPESGIITLANGESIAADLVVGADGIYSTIRTSIVGYPATPPPSGLFCFRCVFDASSLSDISDLAWLTDGALRGPRAIFWNTRTYKMLFIYPIRNGTLINFVAFDEDADQDKTDWVPTATRQDILDRFHDAHPKFLRLLDLPIVTPILKWQLKAVPILPTWIQGRAALLGDAAHGTLPLLGQGASMAIEDAGVLGTLLPFGTKREEVPARLEAYQKLRKERGEFVNIESVQQAADAEKRGSFARSEEMQTMMFDYDAIQVAQDYLNTHFIVETEA